MSAEIDRLEIAVEASASAANKQIDRLIGKLERMSASLSGIDIGKLSSLASGIERLGDSIQSVNGIKTAEFTRLANNIQKIGSINSAGLNSIASSLSLIGRSLNSVGSAVKSSENIAALAGNIGKLGSTNIRNAADNLPRLTTELKNLMATLSQAPNVSKNVIKMTNALAKLGNALKSTNGKVEQSSSSSTGSLRRLSSAFSNLSRQSDRSTRSMKSFSQIAGKFYANSFLIIRALKKMGNAITSSFDYVETFNYWNVAMDKIGAEFAGMYEQYGYESAEAYAESFSDRLKELTRKMTGFNIGDNGELTMSGNIGLALDPEKLMAYQAGIAAVTNSVGLAGENSVNTAKAMSMLAADMSSLKNVKLETVMTNLQSGLIGQSRALYKYGIDITNATLQTYAYKEGIDKAVSEMTQAEKMQLRMLAMLDQSKVAWGDMANTLDSVANQFRVFQQQISNLSRIIGNLFLPIVQKVLPVINGLVIALEKLLYTLGVRLHGDNWLKDIMDGISGGAGSDELGNLADEAEDSADALGDAANKAKKLKSNLQGFDDLNVITTGTDKSASDGKPIDLSGAIGDALAEYESVWDKAFEGMTNKAQEIADKICAALKRIWDLAEPARQALANLWNNGLKLLGQFAWGTLQDFWNNFLKPLGMWTLSDDSGLARFFNITNDLLSEIDWERLKNSLADFYTALQTLAKFVWIGLMDFYEGFLKPVAVWAIGDGLPQLVDIMTRFIDTIDWERILESMRNFWDALAPFATAVGQGLINFFGDLMKFGADFINKVVPGGLDALAEAIRKISPEQAEKIGEAIGKIAVAIFLFKGIGGIIGKIAEFGIKVKTLSAGLGALFGTKGSFSVLGSNISKIFGKGGMAGSALSGFMDTLGNFGAQIGLWVEGLIKTFTGASVSITIPAGAIILGVVAIGAALIDLWKTSETFRDAVGAAFTLVKDSLINAFKAIKDSISPVWEKIKEFGSALYDFYENSGLKKIVEVLASLAAVLAGIVASTVIDIIAGMFKGLVNVLGGVIDILTGVAEILTGIFTLDADKIFSGFEHIGNGIKSIFSGLYEALFGWVNIVKEKVIKFFVDNWDTAIGKIGEIISKFIPSIGQIFDGMKQTFSGIIEFVSGVFTGDWSKALQGIKNIFSGIWNSLVGILKIPLNACIALVERFINSAITAFNVLKKVINSIRVDIPDWIPGIGGEKLGFDLKMTEKVTLPRFENGGYPNTGELFMARENGINEMVGRIGNRPAVANNDQITTAIRDAVVQGMNMDEQNRLLQEQNELLRAILMKPGISNNDIGRSWQTYAREYKNKTGKQLGLSY